MAGRLLLFSAVLAQAAQLVLTWTDASTNETALHVERKQILIAGPPPLEPPSSQPPTPPATTAIQTWLAARKALTVTVRKGQHKGVDPQYELNPEPEEQYARFLLKFHPSWQIAKGHQGFYGEVGKLPGFAGTYGRCGWGGRRANGSCWSARMSNYRDDNGHQLAFYVYHRDMGRWGSSWKWNGTLQPNIWYCVEQRVKLNTPGRADGLLEGWVDGKPAFHRSGIRFRDRADVKVQALWWNVYVGGDWTADRDMTVEFADIALGAAKIGCP
jgi:hypothetical protein